MSPTPVECLVIDPTEPANGSVIWLHGLGADGHDFEPLVPQLGLVERGVRFLLPHAPQQPVTVNGGYVMRAWYDIRWPDLSRDADEAGIRSSIGLVGQLIETEIARGIAPGRIVLAGFSQGGAIVLHAGLTCGRPVGGIMALSTYLALPEALAAELLPANRQVPIFMAHGTADPIAPFALAEASRDHLRGMGCAVDFHRYSMQHSLCPEEVADIRAWLQGIFR